MVEFSWFKWFLGLKCVSSPTLHVLIRAAVQFLLRGHGIPQEPGVDLLAFEEYAFAGGLVVRNLTERGQLVEVGLGEAGVGCALVEVQDGLGRPLQRAELVEDGGEGLVEVLFHTN